MTWSGQSPCRCFPTMSTRAVTLGLLSFGLLLTALITMNGYVALAALPLLAYLGVGFLESPAPQAVRLAARRRLRVRRTGGKTKVEVRVLVRNTGARIARLVLQDSPQAAISVTEGAREQSFWVEAGKSARLEYAFSAVRGNFEWKTIRAVASDPFGLFENAFELPAAAEVSVATAPRRLRSLPLRPGGTLHSPGSILARTSGSGTDFWGVREYHPGDPLRRLDWRRVARHPRQLFTREFEQEEIADIGLILDAGRDFQCRGDSLFEHSLEAAVSLSEAFLRRGNRLTLLVPGDQLLVVHAGFGKAQLSRVLRCLAKARPATGANLSSLDRVPLRPLGSRAMVVIISPSVSSDRLVYARLRARGNQGLLVSPDPVSFLESCSPSDRAGLLAVRLARVERRLALRGIAELGIRVVDWDVRQPLSPLMRRALRPARGHAGKG